MEAKNMSTKTRKSLRLLIVFPFLSAFFIFVGSALLQASDEFQVNTYTSGHQNYSSAAMDGNGNFIIVWQSLDQDGFYYGIYAQRFDKFGDKIDSEFQVSGFMPANEKDPVIALDKKGNFVVAWSANLTSNAPEDIYAQRFNKNGDKLGNVILVNTYIGEHQKEPAIAMDEKGNFVIVWQSYKQDGSMYGVFAQRFNKKGKPLGKEFQVNKTTQYDQEYPAIAMDKKGNFVIVWGSYMQDGSWHGVAGQRFNSKGKKIGSEFQVNTYTENYQDRPAIAMDIRGNFVVAWNSWYQDGSLIGVFAQRFNKRGKAVGPEFQVNTYTESSQKYPTIAIDKKGNFNITWESYEQDGSNYGIYAQKFDKKGQPDGTEFQVNEYTYSYQHWPNIAMNQKGKFVITWYSNEQDGSADGVFAKLYD